MQYIMKGGNPLVGEVVISGAKNAALGILAAAIMTDEPVFIDNLPDVQDIRVLLDAMREIGVIVERRDNHSVKINGSNIHKVRVDNAYIRKIRAGYYLLGALLGKYRHAEVALPGGCNIGSRPIDQHLKGFRAMNAQVDVLHGCVIADAKQLAWRAYLSGYGFGGSDDQCDAGRCAGPGQHHHRERRQGASCGGRRQYAEFSMGANIKGAGTDVIRIRGVERLHGNGVHDHPGSD